jgi:hypothetical protein
MEMENGLAEAARGEKTLQESGERWRRPKLIALVTEASRSLAHLDAERLEELALCCQALNRDLAHASGRRRRALAAEAREAANDMAVFGRVLEATRANLNVMSRLRELRAGRLEYSAPQAPEWQRIGDRHGDN